ncbi:putative G-protein coupled receptor 156 [Astyanax mexicanus]|uniref:G protein-coupled receptor 156 n=1 Tax=Astyanax mexicanus TaxID=7994 RepID=A0A8B9KZJ8_ASTMX|nr:putative G-protein coupled receptor 156 [Astyanax mexicanus]
MELRPNCSAECEAGSCFIHPAVSSPHSWDILLRLCSLSTRVVEVQSRSLSPVLCALVWTLHSCGILLAFFFFIFTIRYKNNRIVKMSSPNLNALTLFGSVLTYTSGFLFAVDDRSPVHSAGPRAVLQARVWTLCIGSSLVFGPILGKTWRLYRVFTQRVPDKRVIIRDIQLMGLVALLILVDVVVLTAWGLTDPVRCSRSVSAVVKVVEFDVHYSLSQLDSCSSHYSELWAILLCAVKCSLLLYGTYLAGLTSNVSLPPVNQSMTITAAVCLVTASTAAAVPVSRYLYAWPNLVYSVISGAIFICTTTINCLLFVPQLTQWRQFEEEVNPHPSQMAKYFSSPSKSLRSMYSEDEVYYLLGENDSMKRLISEKNAVIDSLQEQVNNAKDKLLKLMSVGHLQDDRELDSSNTNLNSCSTQTTVVPLDAPPSPLPDPEPSPSAALSPPPYVHPPPHPSESEPHLVPCLVHPDAAPSAPLASSAFSPPLSSRSPDGSSQKSQDVQLKLECESLTRNTGEMMQKMQKPNASVNIISVSVGPGPSAELNKLISLNKPQDCTPLSPAGTSPPQGETTASVVEHNVPTGGRQGFVSSEQLQEILQDLSVNTVRGVRNPSNPAQEDLSGLVPFSPLSPLSPRSPRHFHLPSISPYMMRKRRPPFHTSRMGPPPYYYPGSAPPTACRRGSAPPGQERLQEQDTKTASTSAQANCTPTQPDSNNHQAGSDEDSNGGHGHTGSCRLSRSQSRLDRRGSRRYRRSSSARRPKSPLEGHRHLDGTRDPDPYGYSDSESSSSEDYCYYHRPYCEACLHNPYASSGSSSTSETSDSEFEELCRSSHPVVNFKEDLKPTFV